MFQRLCQCNRSRSCSHALFSAMRRRSEIGCERINRSLEELRSAPLLNITALLTVLYGQVFNRFRVKLWRNEEAVKRSDKGCVTKGDGDRLLDIDYEQTRPHAPTLVYESRSLLFIRER